MIEIEDDDNSHLKYQISTEENNSDESSIVEVRRLDISALLKTAQQLQYETFGINKQRQLVFAPIFQHIKLEQTFHLTSDIFFDLGFKQRKSVQEQILSYSHFKRIVFTKHLQKEQILILYLENPQDPMKDFTQLQELLLKQPYRRLRILSKLLSEYQKVIKNYEQQIQIVQIQRLLNQVGTDEKILLRKQYREDSLKNKFEMFAKEGQFYSYCMNTANIERGYFEIDQQGYSDSLICLLGSDPEQFTSTIMRKGYPEIQVQRNRDIFNIGRLNYELFESNYQNNRFIGCDCSILTFDDQIIHCGSIVEHYYFEYPPELQINGEQFKTEHVLFVLYQIDINQLKQIIAVRQNNKFMENSDWINDFGYSMMSEILLEKYYKINETKQPNIEDQFLQPLQFNDKFFALI